MFPRLHISLKAVSTDDLMRMWTSQKARVHERIESFDCELRTGKAHHRCATRIVLRVGGAQNSEHMEYSDLHDRNKLFKCECWRSQIARLEMYVHMVEGKDHVSSYTQRVGQSNCRYSKPVSYRLIGVETRAHGACQLSAWCRVWL
jgi:hypothetical protein